ncbi:MAG: hypothetical protein DBX63_03935 [Clostridia bacterium]|nr:MAG: hypothetical protein DBX63_03935 [Clostridia bacterium]
MKSHWGSRFKTWYLLYFLNVSTGQIQAKKKGSKIMKKLVVFMLAALFLLGSFPYGVRGRRYYPAVGL